jgi:hypothetical protein
MPLIEAERIEITSLVNGKDVECECMLCHLPIGAEHGPVEWKLTFRFPGPYPKPDLATMLMCDECYRDWADHPEEFGGFLDSSYRV